MDRWSRLVLGAALRGGSILLAYHLLTPSVWSRSDFESFPILAALAAGGGWRDRDTVRYQKFRAWLLGVVMQSVFLVAVLVVGGALVGMLFGESALQAADQRIVFAGAGVVAMGGGAWHFRQSRRTRSSMFADPDGEARRAEIRASVRREIEEIERGTRNPSL